MSNDYNDSTQRNTKKLSTKMHVAVCFMYMNRYWSFAFASCLTVYKSTFHVWNVVIYRFLSEVSVFSEVCSKWPYLGRPRGNDVIVIIIKYHSLLYLFDDVAHQMGVMNHYVHDASVNLSPFWNALSKCDLLEKWTYIYKYVHLLCRFISFGLND